MTFLNPIFLWASFAITIPIIVHLFNFRRPTRIQFSDISLVKEVRKSVVKRLKLRQWLLLLIRILAILALVFVFSNPVFQNEGTVQSGGNSSVVVMLDNSYSMQGSNDKGSYWIQAQKAGVEIVKGYRQSDEFLIMSSSEFMTDHNFGEQQDAIRTLKSISIRQNLRSLPEILSHLPDIFSNSSFGKKSFYFISDFQKSTILPDTGFTASTWTDIEINLIPLTTRQLKNAYVADQKVTSQIIEVGKPVEMDLQLVNDSKDGLKNIGLKVVTGNETRPVATEDLEAEGSKIINFNLIPKQSGWQSGYIELDDSHLEFDNRRYFSYYVPGREKMLVVEEKPINNLRVMFSGNILGQFDTKFVSFKDFGEENLDEYKSIVLVGLTNISTGMQEKLRTHLEEGRSILFFPGEVIGAGINRMYSAFDLGAFNKLQINKRGDLCAGVDLDHSLFDGVFVGKREQKNFDAPLVFKHYKFRPANGIVQSIILRLGNQDPILIESHPNGGLFYTFTFLPEEGWTDFTVKGVGLSMMIQLARLMNQTNRMQQNLGLGITTHRKVRTKKQDVIKVVSQDSTEYIPEQFVQNGYIVLKFDRQDMKEGNYDLFQNDNLLEKISINIPDAESGLYSLPEQELKEFMAAVGMKNLGITKVVEGGFAEVIQLRNQGLPLWKYFLIAGIIFLLIEFMIHVTNKKTAAFV